LNFVKNHRAIATNVLYDVVYIDHGNMTDTENKLVVKYEESYLKTFKKIVDLLPIKKEHYIWICSSICDYSNFDFKYICDPFARDNLHVFPSDKQKFGDTFFVDVNKLRETLKEITDLEEFNKINYNQYQRVKRLTPPTIVTNDTHVNSVSIDFDFPYSVFVTEDNKDINVNDVEPISLWSLEKKNILITTTGATRIIVPKEIKNFVKKELYDYPYIKTSEKLVKSKPLDIVFLSNGEKCADENYEHLLSITKHLENSVVRVDGVNGRVNSYHKLAEASNTPWVFSVFAKLKVNKDFDFSWQPDRLQISKHYIFNSKNPVTGLIYGHQGMIAYNKKLVLNNQGLGLDFTLDDPHESINMLSGTAMFNTDEFSTWRTSFREAIKLHHDTNVISKERLEKWLTVGQGNFGEFSIMGAKDAIEYYNSVNGDFAKLKLSYEWKWLNDYFTQKYK